MRYVKCLEYVRNLLDFDMKFNSSKSIAMRIGERYKVKCEPLMLCGSELQFVESEISWGAVCGS